MKSDKIEYFRFDDLKTGILMGGKPYILAHGDFNTLCEVHTPISQIELLDKLSETLRYSDDPKSTSVLKQEAIKEFSDQIKPLFIPTTEISPGTTHLEVYLNPSELALIPFELLLKENGKPLFVQDTGDSPFILTRNMRREVKRHTGNPPEVPRVLYAYTKPDHKNHLNLPFPDIPFKDHEQSIKYALRHWDPENQLTVLHNPTFDNFREAVHIADAENRPFTHIHLLAHGSLLFDHKNPSNFEYGIAFYSSDSTEVPLKPVAAQQLRELFDSLHQIPYMISYMICDGANFTNGIKPDRNPVHASFNAGIPVVIGSQFPLSAKGSNMITKELYKRLFRADDIRLIVGDLRTKLFNDGPEGGHDWISLVSYIDLPNDYDIQLLMLKLRCQLQVLNHVRADFADPVSSSAGKTKDEFISAKFEIEASIADLSLHLSKVELQESAEAYFLENSSLLGSAFKRLAELEFKEASVLGSDTALKQKEYLEASRKWYKKASDRNLSHHWSLIQYISLSTVLLGSLAADEEDYWNIAKRAALTDVETSIFQGKKPLWPYGTLIELYLLAPEKITDDAKEMVMKYTQLFLKNAESVRDRHCTMATLFQLKRYLDWWLPPLFELKPHSLASNTGFLKSIIDKFQSNISGEFNKA